MTKTSLFSLIVALLSGMSLCTPSALGQIVLSGTGYTQNFDDISHGLPPGWTVRTNANDTSLGEIAEINTNAVSWGTTSRGFRNCAGTTDNSGMAFEGTESAIVQAGATNRCPAVRQTTSFGDPGAAFVFQIADTLGVSNLTFSVDLNLLWTNSSSTVWSVEYAVGNSPSVFTLLGTYDDPGVPDTTNASFTLGPDAENQPDNIWIRVVALSDSTGGGSRDTFGIDNFALNYDGLASPGIPLSIQADGDNAVLTWDDPGYALQAAPEPDGTYTNIPDAASPFTNAMNDPAEFFRLTPD